MTFQQRYDAAVHSIQTAIGFRFSTQSPWMDDRMLNFVKHLRVGIDTTKADHVGLANLLIAKGVFTVAEYQDAVLEANEKEAEMQQDLLKSVIAPDNPNLKIRTI